MAERRPVKTHLPRRPARNFPSNLHFDPPLARPGEYVVVDFETQGLDPEKPVIEVAAVFVREGKVRRAFSSLVQPGMPQPPEIVRLTGITDEMLANARSLFEAARRLGGVVGRDPVPIFAHNMAFDAKVVWCHGVADMVVPDCTFCDSLALARAAFQGLPSYSLDSLSETLGLRREKAHRALDDAVATAELIERCYDRLEGMHTEFSVEIPHACPSCGSSLLSKHGHDRGRQRYRCKECETKFTPPNIRTDAEKADDKRRRARLEERNATVGEARAEHDDGLLHCPHCKSTDLRKQERRPGRRRYLCKECGKKTTFWDE